LSHRRAERRREVGRIHSDLDLLDETRLVRVLVLDRVLDRDDVPSVAAVDLLDERRESRRLAGARGAADQDEAARQARERFGARRKAQRGESRRIRRQGPDRGSGPSTLAMKVDPEAARPPDLEGEVRHRLLRVTGTPAGGKSRKNRLLDLFARERGVRERHDPSVDADRGRRAGDEQQIASRTLDERLEPRLQPRGASRLAPGGSVLVQLADELVDVLDFVHGVILRNRPPERRFESSGRRPA
jgi:hypothetical protein